MACTDIMCRFVLDSGAQGEEADEAKARHIPEGVNELRMIRDGSKFTTGCPNEHGKLVPECISALLCSRCVWYVLHDFQQSLNQVTYHSALMKN